MKYSNGAALLIVMAMIVLLQLVVLHTWFIAGLTADLAEQRKIRYSHFYMTEAIFDACLRWIEHDFDGLQGKVAAQSKECTFDATRLLQKWFAYTKSKSIVLTVRQSGNKKDSQTLACGATLCEGRLPICSLRCMLTKIPPTSRIKEPHFVVSYWTFSTDV
jgi:hypothetical protein